MKTSVISWCNDKESTFSHWYFNKKPFANSGYYRAAVAQDNVQRVSTFALWRRRFTKVLRYVQT